ncbi:Histone-lysine N-methyltransferase ASHR3 [Hibiscus syriacus]|uniref:Histone-lysine N-methyltransferase ASHR3 n=1 Tax=Hibiscus syriacus TaxID=106335 RepID=A0A6A3B3D9_HIBSY|nr:Histone-lysine N-methyltransferase ASHR3 [Hibiscus syriacus]
MPDLGHLSQSSSLSLSHCPNLRPLSVDSADSLEAFDTATLKTIAVNCKWDQSLVQKRVACNSNGIKVLKKVKKGSNGKVLKDYLRDWVQRKMESGLPQSFYFLPFIVGAKRLVECLDCHKHIYPGEEMVYLFSFQLSGLVLFLQHWYASFADKDYNGDVYVVRWHHMINAPHGRMRLADRTYLLNEQHAVPATGIEEVFCQLPLPYMDEEFKLDMTWRDLLENKFDPPPYVHIKRNAYLVKKKRDNVVDDIGCASCSSTCSEDCVCRVQCISCSKACHCPESCTNRPFSKEKKIKIVKTELCGWGVEAAEPIKKGDFVIEYIGEVIDDAQCEKRLWDMKYKGVKNFYMCEIRKDFTIDATFKGNTSRFLNHSCDPNCVLEKWQVEGETRVGVFAARSIEVGEPLTYDYRFVQFGPEVKCHCGASNCQGYLGTKRKIVKLDLCWGLKRRRTSTACLAIITI